MRRDDGWSAAAAGRDRPLRRFGGRNAESSGDRVLAELRLAGQAMLDPSVPQHLADIVRTSGNRRG